MRNLEGASGSHPGVDQGYELRTVTSLSQFAALRPAWTSLVSRALDPDPFVTHEWLTCWWDAFGDGRDMLVLTAWKQDRMVAAAPLYVVERRMWGTRSKVLRLWSNPYSNRINLVVDRDEGRAAIESLVGHVTERGGPNPDVIILEPLVDDAATTRLLLDVLRGQHAKHWVSELYRSPFAVLPKSVQELEAGLSAGFRKTLRRKVNAGKRAAIVTSVSSDPELLTTAFAISEETWQHDEGTGIGSSVAVRKFYEAVAHAAAERGWLQLAFAHVGDAPACFEYNLVFENKVYNLKLGYRPDFARLSPGLVLRNDLMETLIREHRAEYDFLGVDEPYKLHWTDRVRRHCRITIVSSWKLIVPYLFYGRIRPFVEQRMPWVMDVRRRVRQRLRGSDATGQTAEAPRD